MSSLPWKPLRLSIDLDRQVEDAFAELIHRTWGPTSRLDAWRPEVDLYENDDEYVIQADLPGVRCGDVKIEAREHEITISGSRQNTELAHTARGVRLERWQGHFERTFHVEHPVDPQSVRHECSEGTYLIRVRKRRVR